MFVRGLPGPAEAVHDLFEWSDWEDDIMGPFQSHLCWDPQKMRTKTIVGEWTPSHLKVRSQDIGKNVCYTHWAQSIQLTHSHLHPDLHGFLWTFQKCQWLVHHSFHAFKTQDQGQKPLVSRFSVWLVVFYVGAGWPLFLQFLLEDLGPQRFGWPEFPLLKVG